MTRKLSISMPDIVADYMYSRLRSGGYGSISEYLRELVRLDQRYEVLRGARLDRSLIDRFGHKEDRADGYRY